MICWLCLDDLAEVIDIFGETGIEQNVACVLSKFFLFELKEDNFISTVVCHVCWSKVADFNEFYENVNQAHRSLAEDLLDNNDKQTFQQNEEQLRNADSGFLGAFTSDSDQETENFQFVFCDVNKKNEFEDEYQYSESIVESENQKARNLEYLETPSNCSNNICHENIHYEGNIEATSKVNIPKTNKQGKHIEKSTKKERSSNKNIKRNSIAIDKKIANFMHLICDVCKMEQPTFVHLKKHMQVQHGCRGFVLCCGTKLHSRINLLDHIEKHFNPRVYSCEICKITFQNKGCLRKHNSNKHLPEEEKNFLCEKCSRKFTWSYLLEQHNCEKKNTNTFCKYCKKLFSKKQELDNHIIQEHTENTYSCEICEKIFHSKLIFEKHLLGHIKAQEEEEEENKRVQCVICQNWLKNKQTLGKHILRHVPEKSHKCDICEKSFRTRYDLSNHKRYVHGKLWSCQICYKTFKRPSTLKEHKSVHTGEDLYECQYCTKTFRYITLLCAHRKRVHPEYVRTAKNLQRKS